jgi:hypothetical protein
MGFLSSPKTSDVFIFKNGNAIAIRLSQRVTSPAGKSRKMSDNIVSVKSVFFLNFDVQPAAPHFGARLTTGREQHSEPHICAWQ